MAKTAVGYVEVTFRFAQEGDLWTAECVELGTAAFADSLPKAYTAIQEMVTLHLNALGAVGECESFLKENGVVFHRGEPLTTRRKSTSRPRVRTGEGVFRARVAIPLAATSA